MSFFIRALIVPAALLAAAAHAQEEPLPSGPYDPQPGIEAGGQAPGSEPAEAVPPAPGSEPAAEEAGEADDPGPRIISIPKEKKPYFLSGARPLPLTDSALRMDLGYPDVRVAWHIPVSRTFELAPAFGVAYGLHAENAGELALVDLRCEIKWHFYSNEEIALALFADPGLQVSVWPAAGVGFVVGGPGLILDYEVIEELHLTPAVQIPWGLYFMGEDTDFAARFPFLLRLGMEYHLSPTVNLLFHMSGGADVWTSPVSPGGSVAALLRMIFGVSIRL